MAQKRIPLEPGQMYHVWTHANGSENLFRTEENYRYFLEKYAYYLDPVVETYAYCLMPNHLHLMVCVGKEKEVLDFLRDKKDEPSLQGFGTLGGISKVISLQFSHLFNGYTQAYNKKYDRKGSLFIPNFNRKLIDSQEYFSRLIVYIHNNPMHHGFVTEPGDWAHSSWHAYISDKATKVKKSEGLTLFGGLPAFEELHQRLKPGMLTSFFEG